MKVNSTYTPLFTVSAEAISLVAEISAQIERYTIRLEQTDGLRLRKANRIKTIHSSLAIEGNNLSEGQVRDIIDGKQVIAPLREIQEVKNAIKAYDLYKTLNPFAVEDLLKAHGTMMQALADDAGMFRKSGVGVFDGEACLHMAPPAWRVPELIDELFAWLKTSKDHLLIRSCVFHYEFEFIHPFSDGNGRMGRLWQSLILGKLSPIFESLPVENLVYSSQQQYYDAIAESSDRTDCGPFIDFMLGEILKTLKQHQGIPIQEGGVPDKVPDKVPDNYPSGLSRTAKDILRLIRNNPYITSAELGRVTGISERMVRKHIATLKAAGLIKRIGGNKGGHWEIFTIFAP